MLVLSLLGVSLLGRPAVAAVGGDLDTSFGGDGIVTTPIGSGSDWGAELAIDSQGRIVLAGTASVGATEDFALARYNPDGSLDTSFGTGGKVTTPIGGGGGAYAMAIDGQGRLVLAGEAENGGTRTDFALARYNPDGSLDTSFGTGGKVVIAQSEHQTAYDLAIDAQGRIVVVGMGLLVRLNPDGSLDGSFGTGGKVVEGEDDGALAAVAIDSQGRIVTTIPQITSIGWTGWLSRYHPDGGLDGSFGTGGKVDIEFGSDVAIDSQGRIVTSGHPYSADSGSDLAGLARYSPDGSLDGSFGTGGSVASIYRGTASSIVLDAQSRIVFAGTTIGDEFALGRAKPDGTLDTSFSIDGMVFTAISSGYDAAAGLAIDSKGRIVVGGSSSIGSDSDFTVARYIADDTDSPETTITKGAPTRTHKSSVKFKFSSDERDSTFEYKLDTKAWKPCTSPRNVKNLKEGKHVFRVRATDSAGNTDPTPAKDKFKVVD